MSEHTKWLYAKDPDINYFDDYIIRQPGNVILIARVFGLQGKDSSSREHAEFIVRAVNNHDRLLRACKKAVIWNLPPDVVDQLETAIALAEKGKNHENG